MRVRLSNRQSEAAVRVRPLQRQLNAALPLLPRPLPVELEVVEITLIDRATMRRVHADFLNDPSETDVITFPYGEIVVCPAVAHDRAEEFGHTPEREVLLYCLHGLLHLAGYDDRTPRLAREMAAAQDRLLAQL